MKDARGFTLIEVLMTMAIAIVVLATVDALVFALTVQRIKNEQKIGAQDFLRNAVRVLETNSGCGRSLTNVQVSKDDIKLTLPLNPSVVQSDKFVELVTLARLKPRTVGRAIRVGDRTLYRQMLQVELSLAALPIRSSTRFPARAEGHDQPQPMASRFADIPVVTSQLDGGQVISCGSDSSTESSCLEMGWTWDANGGCHARPTGTCIYQGSFSVAKPSGEAIQLNPTTGSAACPAGSTQAITGQTDAAITYNCLSCS